MRNYLAEWVLKQVILARRRRATPPARESYGDYFEHQFRSSPAIFSRYPDFDPSGKSVLEIGCGTGGRTAYLASVGASRTVGIDINAGEIAIARQLCAELKPHISPRVEFIATEEKGFVPEIGQFDYVVLVDTMEHVVSPPVILKLAYDYTKPGGACYFNTVGWYNYNGSHCHFMPFVNLFFSDETILNVVRWNVARPDYRPSRFDSSPPLERWRGIYDLRDRPGEHLNKITIREIRKLVRYTIFDSARMTVVPFSHPIGRIFNPFRHIPVLQEVCHAGIVVDLRKRSD
jgi:SAM-dependent methyltransferase